jgi:hypothetical protein
MERAELAQEFRARARDASRRFRQKYASLSFADANFADPTPGMVPTLRIGNESSVWSEVASRMLLPASDQTISLEQGIQQETWAAGMDRTTTPTRRASCGGSGTGRTAGAQGQIRCRLRRINLVAINVVRRYFNHTCFG